MRSPARKLKRSPVKNIVRFPAMKANDGKTILVESILESKYCLHLEFDSDVTAYFPQPQTFTVPGEDDDSTYTPDFEVRYASGDCHYVEVKPLERASSAHYQRSLNASNRPWLTPTNYAFLAIDELEIHQRP